MFDFLRKKPRIDVAIIRLVVRQITNPLLENLMAQIDILKQSVTNLETAAAAAEAAAALRKAAPPAVTDAELAAVGARVDAATAIVVASAT